MLSIGTPLCCPGSDTPGCYLHSTAVFPLPVLLFASPQQGQEIQISWGKGPEGAGKQAHSTKRAGAGVS